MSLLLCITTFASQYFPQSLGWIVALVVAVHVFKSVSERVRVCYRWTPTQPVTPFLVIIPPQYLTSTTIWWIGILLFLFQLITRASLHHGYKRRRSWRGDLCIRIPSGFPMLFITPASLSPGVKSIINIITTVSAIPTCLFACKAAFNMIARSPEMRLAPNTSECDSLLVEVAHLTENLKLAAGRVCSSPVRAEFKWLYIQLRLVDGVLKNLRGLEAYSGSEVKVQEDQLKSIKNSFLDLETQEFKSMLWLARGYVW